MQRYCGGVKLPRFSTDVFPTPSTDFVGEISCILTYPAKANSIQVQFEFSAARLNRFVRVSAHMGQYVDVTVYKLVYDKPDTPTAADAGSTGGAANHSHGLTYTATAAGSATVSTEAQPNLCIHYETG